MSFSFVTQPYHREKIKIHDLKGYHMNNTGSSNFWHDFAKQEALTQNEVEQFKQYYELLIEWNKKFNLTAITDEKEVIAYHFQDSLALQKLIDCKAVKTLADIGTGAGFPALPLKIKFPHLKLVLIEVNKKRISFLQHVCQQLNLHDIEMVDLDWRSFLRKTDYKIDVVCARASLRPPELFHMFKPSCFYNNAQLVYWAADSWQPRPKEKVFLKKEQIYEVGDKKRKLVLFEKN